LLFENGGGMRTSRQRRGRPSVAEEEAESRYFLLEDNKLSKLFPLLRPEVTESFEMAARLGDRDRLGIRPLTPPKLATALKYLGVLDGKRVSRATVDLLYIELIKDQHRPGRNDKEGITLELFGRALNTLAVRLYPVDLLKSPLATRFTIHWDCTAHF